MRRVNGRGFEKNVESDSLRIREYIQHQAIKSERSPHREVYLFQAHSLFSNKAARNHQSSYMINTNTATLRLQPSRNTIYTLLFASNHLVLFSTFYSKSLNNAAHCFSPYRPPRAQRPRALDCTQFKVT